MSVFIAYDPNAHGVLHPPDWTTYDESDVDGGKLQIIGHQPTGLKFFIASDFDADGKFLSFGAVCQNAPFNRLEQPDMKQIAQQAIRFYCASKNTTPEAEQRKAEAKSNTPT